MFDALSNRLTAALGRLGNKGRIGEKDVDAALREVRLALLEADVNFRVAKDLVAAIKVRALGADVLKSITPGQQVIKITHIIIVEQPHELRVLRRYRGLDATLESHGGAHVPR